ncbi:MAG: LPS export ABC transporter periplasmic protein LptC [Gammaproteobacteria bacterium]|nr:LPS export ABC transporter periplasmic protein LptC [Gammaproteobacteria bacterium]
MRPSVLILAMLGLGGCSSDLRSTDDSARETMLERGYSARDAEIVETGADGRPRFTLQAALIEQRPASRDIVLTDIDMRLQAADTQWHLQAKRGSMPAAAQRILLDGDVRLEGQPAGTVAPLRIRTEQLNYDLATSRALAPGAVSILLQDHRLEGTGLEADLKTYQARIRADVHGRFTP